MMNTIQHNGGICQVVLHIPSTVVGQILVLESFKPTILLRDRCTLNCGITVLDDSTSRKITTNVNGHSFLGLEDLNLSKRYNVYS